jgi:hypothetical protein
VKRTPAGSGRVPVASGTGTEAPAAAGGVGAAPVSLGRRWSCRSTWTEDRARAGRRDGAGGPRPPGETWAVLGGGGGSSAAAATHASGRDREK